MTQEAAVEVLRKEGFRVNTNQLDQNIAVAVRDNLTRVLSLCNGRVVSYSIGVNGGITAFIKIIKDETQRSGEGTYEAKSIQADIGELNTMTIRWQRPGGAFTVSYVAPSKAAAESVSYYHSIDNECRRK